MSRKRHEKRGKGGRAEREIDEERVKDTPYNAQGSQAERDAKDEKDGFKRGGHKRRRRRGGKVEGRRPHARADKRRRSGGRAERSPLTTAAAVQLRPGMELREGRDRDRDG